MSSAIMIANANNINTNSALALAAVEAGAFSLAPVAV
jgi:hypothetical protein